MGGSMDINATIFVQAGNFFIAYLLFRYLFLKPAYQELCADESHRHSLEDTVAHDKRSVEKERQRQRDAWSRFTGWCAEYLPLVKSRRSFFRGISRALTIKSPSKSEEKAVRDKLVRAMAQAFKERYE